MKTMLINILGLLMIAFVMFLIFKKIKSLLPSFLCSTVNKQPVQTEHLDDLETDSENEEDMN